eukprot:1851731-Rhodomonas_salina.1
MHTLVDAENWMTDTEHEDAIIMKTFYFKITTKYFALFLVAFLVNYAPLFDEHYRCPDWQCMPVVQVRPALCLGAVRGLGLMCVGAAGGVCDVDDAGDPVLADGVALVPGAQQVHREPRRQLGAQGGRRHQEPQNPHGGAGG